LAAPLLFINTLKISAMRSYPAKYKANY